MSDCKNCEHLTWENEGTLFHYRTYKGQELRTKCWTCDCEKPE